MCPMRNKKGISTADYGVFEQYITDMFGCKKEDLGDGYCLYKDDKKRQKMIICKKDDEGFSFMFNFKKGNIESECFTKLDATSRDFIFHSGKNSALQKNNNSFPVTFTGFCKDNQYRTLFRNDNGRLDIKTQPVDGGMFDGSDYFYGSKHSNNRRDSRGNGELRRLRRQLMKYRRIKGMEDYCTNFFRWRKNSI